MSYSFEMPRLIESSLFTGQAKDGFYQLTAEASDLKGLWQGEKEIVVKSHRTGNTARFFFQRKVVDHEGDIQAWHFHSSTVSCRLTIFND